MRRVLLLCTLLLMIGTSSLPAQSRIRVIPTAGASLTTSPEAFERFYSLSPELGVGVEYQLTRSLSLHGRVHYARLLLSKENVSRFIDERTRNSFTDIAVTGQDGTMFSGTVRLAIRAQLPRGLRFRGLFGIGLYRHSIYDVTVSDNSTPTNCPDDCFTIESLDTSVNPGFAIGFRLSTPLSPRFTPFVEPDYTIIFADQDASERLPSEVGNISYFSIRAGVSVGI